MATPKTTANPQLVLPSAASGSSVTPSSSAWVSSAWVQLTASSGAAWSVVGVIVNPGIGVVEFEIEIGKGAATSEVVVATTGGVYKALSGTGDQLFFFGVPVDIASGTRIAVRLRKEGTSVTAWTAKLVYYTTDAGVGTTSNVPSLAPAAAAGASLTPNASAWVNSAWVELSSSLTDVCAIGLIANPGDTSAVEFELDLGVGATGEEGVKATTAGVMQDDVGPVNVVRFPWPIRLAGTGRVSARLRKDTTTATAWTVKLLYVSTAGFADPAPEYTKQPQKIAPDAAAMTGNSAASWANGAWVQLIASTANAIVVVQHCMDTGNNAEYEIDAGKGPATSETVVSTSGDVRVAQTASTTVMEHAIPVDNIAASTRVAVRHRRSSSGAGTFDMGFAYYEKPL